MPAGWLAPWVERSWQRCLHLGLEPQQAVVFDAVSPQHMLRTQEANQRLVQTARPILEKLGRAIVNTRYFAILTNRDGVVVDTSGAIDRSRPARRPDHPHRHRPVRTQRGHHRHRYGTERAATGVAAPG